MSLQSKGTTSHLQKGIQVVPSDNHKRSKQIKRSWPTQQYQLLEYHKTKAWIQGWRKMVFRSWKYGARQVQKSILLVGHIAITPWVVTMVHPLIFTFFMFCSASISGVEEFMLGLIFPGPDGVNWLAAGIWQVALQPQAPLKSCADSNT